MPSRLSCMNSRSWISPDLIVSSSAMRVHILLSDLDGRSVKNASDAIKVHFAGQAVRVRWDQTSSELVADISEDLTNEPGEYKIAVQMAVWNYTVEQDQNSTCILLQKSVTVVEAQRIGVWVLVSSLVICAILILTIVIWAKTRSKDLKEILIMVMTETVKLALSIVFDASDLITDMITSYKVVFEDGVVMSTRWKIAFAVFGCLSTIVGLVSLLHHGQQLWVVRRQLASHLREKDRTYATADEARLAQLTWEEKKLHRDMHVNAGKVLALIFEDVPMIMLTCALVISEGVTDKVVRARLGAGCVR